MDLISLLRSKAKQVKETNAWVEIPTRTVSVCVRASVCLRYLEGVLLSVHSLCVFTKPTIAKGWLFNI